MRFYCFVFMLLPKAVLCIDKTDGCELLFDLSVG